MRLLLDENNSDRRLGARLRAQGHDPVLATGVGLLSATDARVFIAAITQALPVLTRDSEDFTDLHDLIMAAGGHHSGVLVVRDPEQVRKLAGWGLTQDGNTFRIIDQLADALGTEVQPPFGPREHCHRMPRFRCTGAHRRLLHITKRGAAGTDGHPAADTPGTGGPVRPWLFENSQRFGCPQVRKDRSIRAQGSRALAYTVY